jgi:prepilin-type N-terminal cleavage/methylation domain-containing protein
MVPRFVVRRSAGYTLVEILLALVLLSVITGSIAMIGGAGTRLFCTSATRGSLEADAHRALGHIQLELLSSDHASLDTFPTAPFWDDRMVFDQPEEFDARYGTIQWSSTVIELRSEGGELDDGLDNDGDGLVDEGVVALVKDWNGPAERTVILCRGVSEYFEGEIPNGLDDNGNGLVDEKGLCFDHSDGNLSLRLSVQRADPEHVVVTRTFESSVWLRN